MHHEPAVADALDVSTDVKVPGDGGGTVAAAGGVHAQYRQRTRLRCCLQARPPRQRLTSGAACAELQCCRGRLAPGSILLRRPARGAPCARCGVRLMRSAWCGPSPSLKTSSVVLHAIRHRKPRLFGQGCVANPRDTYRYRCGLRLALTKNPSAFNVPSSMQHHTSTATGTHARHDARSRWTARRDGVPHARAAGRGDMGGSPHSPQGAHHV